MMTTTTFYSTFTKQIENRLWQNASVIAFEQNCFHKKDADLSLSLSLSLSLIHLCLSIFSFNLKLLQLLQPNAIPLQTYMISKSSWTMHDYKNYLKEYKYFFLKLVAIQVREITCVLSSVWPFREAKTQCNKRFDETSPCNQYKKWIWVSGG